MTSKIPDTILSLPPWAALVQRPFYPPELDCEFGLKERGAFYGKKALGRKTGLAIWRTEHWLKVPSGRGGGEAGQDGESCPKLRDALLRSYL